MKTAILAAAALAASAMSASAAVAASSVITLTFEGIADRAPVGDFYGPGYVFSSATLALIDRDAGGTGDFANEPSPNTIMAFLSADNAVLNVTNGFTDGFSFYYSSLYPASVTVWDGLDGTGTMLGHIDLLAQASANDCKGDPWGDAYCNWSAVGVSFTGTAYSINFGGTANKTGFDNITFGSETPGISVPGVPEPASWAMLILGFGLIGSAMRRRRATPASA